MLSLLKTQPLHHRHPAQVLQAGLGENVPLYGRVLWKIRSELRKEAGDACIPYPAISAAALLQHTVRPFCWVISQILLPSAFSPKQRACAAPWPGTGAALTGGMVGCCVTAWSPRCCWQPLDALLSRMCRIAFRCQVCSNFSFLPLLIRVLLPSCQGGVNVSHRKRFFSAEEGACSCESGFYLIAMPSVQPQTDV